MCPYYGVQDPGPRQGELELNLIGTSISVNTPSPTYKVGFIDSLP